MKQRNTKRFLSLVMATLLATTLIQPVAQVRASQTHLPAKAIAEYKAEDDIYSRYDDVYDYSEERAIVLKGSKYGYIDLAGKEVIKTKYEEANSFINGFATVKFKGKWGLINKKGKTVIPFKYSVLGSYYSGKIAAKLKGKMGYLDAKGKVVIPFKYDRTYDFQGNLAQVEKK